MRWTLLLGLLLLAATVPVMPDPFYHKSRVTFLHWLAREIEEAYTGERH